MIGRLAWVLVLFNSAAEPENELAVKMHNEAQKLRKQYNLSPQTLDAECCDIAQKWAEKMAADHAMYHGGGEQIIAVGYVDVDNVFRAWMASSGHRYWVLSGADRAGWGAAKSSTGRWYWAGAFRSTKKKAEQPVYYTPRRRFKFFRR